MSTNRLGNVPSEEKDEVAQETDDKCCGWSINEARKQGSKESRKQGSKEARKQGSKEARKQGSKEASIVFTDTIRWVIHMSPDGWGYIYRHLLKLGVTQLEDYVTKRGIGDLRGHDLSYHSALRQTSE
eukprot:scaffold208_cov63-Attheya_sp.AAC.11